MKRKKKHNKKDKNKRKKKKKSSKRKKKNKWQFALYRVEAFLCLEIYYTVYVECIVYIST